MPLVLQKKIPICNWLFQILGPFSRLIAAETQSIREVSGIQQGDG